MLKRRDLSLFTSLKNSVGISKDSTKINEELKNEVLVQKTCLDIINNLNKLRENHQATKTPGHKRSVSVVA